jgi:Regulator of Ty1 transposition protein 107 BRCT domain
METSKLTDFQISDEEDSQPPEIAQLEKHSKNTKLKVSEGKEKVVKTKKITAESKKPSDRLKHSVDQPEVELNPDQDIPKPGPSSSTVTPKPKKETASKKLSKKPLSVSKSVLNELDSLSSTRKRKRIGSSEVRVLFAGGCDDSNNTKFVQKLGGEVVKEWSQCTHMVTDKLKRTIKFLCCLSSGRQIVGLQWINDSLKENQWLGKFSFLTQTPQSI